MRILILTLILAIGFSGYSAAAHAFAMESCGSAAIEKTDCADHHDNQISDHGSDQHQSDKGVCLDCHHCCSSHAAGLPDYSVDYPPQARLHHPAPADVYSDHFAFSLLRPPKSLV